MTFDCDILFALLGDVRANSRALRQLRALSAAGLSVRVLSLKSAATVEPEIPDVRFETIPTPSPRGPAFFLAAHQRFREAGSKIAARLYHASDLFVLPALAGRARKVQSVLTYDARELYSGLGATYKRPWASAIWYAVEKRFIHRATRVFTVNQSIANRLADRYGVPPPVVIPNVPEIAPHAQGGRLRSALGVDERTPIVLYQGYLKPGRGCEQLLRAMADIPYGLLVFLGEGSLESPLRRLARQLDLQERIRFLPPVPPDDLLAFTADADIGSCLIEPLTESLRLSLPNKLFEYLISGVPVIASPLPEISRVVEEYDVGLTANPHNHVELVEALGRMLTDDGARRRYARNTIRVREDFDGTAIARRFADELAAVLEQRVKAEAG